MNPRQRAECDLASVEALSAELLRRGGVSRPPVPANLIGLFDPSREVHVATGPLIAPVRGLLQPDGRRWLVILAARLSPQSRRFTLFHEGFHILHRCGAARAEGPREYVDWLADQFAARILMPRRWVTERAGQADIGHLAYLFGVSRRAMERRIRELR